MLWKGPESLTGHQLEADGEVADLDRSGSLRVEATKTRAGGVGDDNWRSDGVELRFDILLPQRVLALSASTSCLGECVGCKLGTEVSLLPPASSDSLDHTHRRSMLSHSDTTHQDASRKAKPGQLAWFVQLVPAALCLSFSNCSLLQELGFCHASSLT